MLTREHAKVTLKEKGWTYRTAATVLGVTFQHLSYVLNGHRASRRILTAIEAMPERKEALAVDYPARVMSVSGSASSMGATQ